MDTMTINDRIKAVRKAQKLNQTEFGKKIGLKQMAVSNLEQKGNTVTEKNIIIICQRFHIRRDWLVNGDGEMYAPNGTTLFSAFAKEHDLSPMEQVIANFVLTITPEERKILLNLFTRLADAMQDMLSQESSISKETSNYRMELEAQKAGQGKLPPSGTTAATEKDA